MSASNEIRRTQEEYLAGISWASDVVGRCTIARHEFITARMFLELTTKLPRAAEPSNDRGNSLIRFCVGERCDRNVRAYNPMEAHGEQVGDDRAQCTPRTPSDFSSDQIVQGRVNRGASQVITRR